MSKIQAVFNGTGRELRDAERRSMDAFVARYQGTLTTPPGLVRIASVGAEQPKSRQVTVNGEFVKVAPPPKGRLKKAMDRRKKLAKSAAPKFFKKAVLKVSGF